MAYIPPGEFQMGCSFDDLQCQPDESPRTWVRMTEGFCMDRTEVTQARYSEATGKAIKQRKKCGPGCPVTGVSWDDARKYCESIGKRLPTEAEWEYAAKGGFDTRYYSGHNLSGNIAWFQDNCGGDLRSVATKQPNAYGLYDMLGNAWEWVNDCYREDYYRWMPLENPSLDISGCEARVLRGGSAQDIARDLRASYRISNPPDYVDDYFGFRCAGDF